MLRRTIRALCDPGVIAGLDRNRAAQAQQFGVMDGWQAGQDPRFDAYVANKRREERFDSLDQRVERAYQAALKGHKAEVWNSFKRRLKGSGDRLTHDVVREVNRAVEERKEWLRDVWAQIDADYRSRDERRSERAAKEITKALDGEASDYIAWAYDRKQERRFLGEKGKAAFDSEYDSAGMPEISEDEANRYHSLRLSMQHIEEAVKEKYGAAGEEHWRELQASKDKEYIEKLDVAAEKYKMLLQQQDAYDESVAGTEARLHVQRVQKAKVRFDAAMELETEREKLIEAYNSMQKERAEKQRERTKDKLQLAAQLRAEGKTPRDVAEVVKMQTLDKYVAEHDLHSKREQERVLGRQRKFTKMLEEVRSEAERNPEGLGLEEYKFASDDADEYWKSAKQLAANRGADGTSPAAKVSATKKALWDVINEEKHSEGFKAVHQARLDAMKFNDPIYWKMHPTELAMGSKKKIKQNSGEDQAGGGKEGGMLKTPVMKYFTWEMDASQLDQTKDRTYYADPITFTRRKIDESTGAPDPRYQTRSGSVIWDGPRFYKLGAEYRDNIAGNQPRSLAPRAGHRVRKHERED